MSAAMNEMATPTAGDIELAREGLRLIGQFGPGQSFRLEIGEGDSVQEVRIPIVAAKLLYDLLREMAEGNAVTLIPVHAELTTQQAADLLNVSRPYLVGLLDSGHIPFRKVGTHRRVRFDDLRKYKSVVDSKRSDSLDALAADGQDLGLGY